MYIEASVCGRVSRMEATIVPAAEPCHGYDILHADANKHEKLQIFELLRGIMHAMFTPFGKFLDTGMFHESQSGTGRHRSVQVINAAPATATANRDSPKPFAYSTPEELLASSSQTSNSCNHGDTQSTHAEAGLIR